MSSVIHPSPGPGPGLDAQCVCVNWDVCAELGGVVWGWGLVVWDLL